MDDELDKVLFKLRTSREVELNDNRWTTEFVYPLDEAKQELETLIEDRVAQALKPYKQAEQKRSFMLNPINVFVDAARQRAKSRGIDL